VPKAACSEMRHDLALPTLRHPAPVPFRLARGEARLAWAPRAPRRERGAAMTWCKISGVESWVRSAGIFELEVSDGGVLGYAWQLYARRRGESPAWLRSGEAPSAEVAMQDADIELGEILSEASIANRMVRR